MNEIKIYLKSSGSTAELYKDFNLYQDSYRNVQITIYVPSEITYENADNTYFNTVQTGAIMTAPNGAKVVTKSNNAAFVKTEVQNGVEYAVYTQVMPKEYALYAGTQLIVCNVVSVDNTDDAHPQIISVTASQRAPLTVLESAYLSDGELLDPAEAEVIEGLINNLQQRLNKGEFAARAIYAWNSTYTYGAGELVFYPQKGEYGVFLKSLTDNNKAEPYVNGALDTANWLLVSDFNILTELYSLKGDVETAVQETRDNVAAAQKIVEDGETDIAGIIAQGKNDMDGIISAGQAEIDATAARAEQSASEAATAAQNASGSEAQAKSYADEAADKATEAQNWAELAQHYAQFGIKLNTDYQSVEELPTEGNPQYIYLIPNGSAGNNSYDEYMWIADKGAYEKIGTTEVDLTSYATKAEVAETYATKEMLSEETKNRQTQDQRLNTRILANENNLSAEQTARENEVQQLSELISAEETARENADTALENRIDGNEANITTLQSGKVNKSGDTMTGNLSAPIIHGTSQVQENGQRVYSSNYPPPKATANNFGTIKFRTGFEYSVDLNSTTNGNIVRLSPYNDFRMDYPRLLTVFGVETAQHGCIYISRDTNINSTWSNDNNNGSNILAKVEGEQGYWSRQYLCCSVLVPANTAVYIYGRYIDKVRCVFQPIFAIT